MWLLVETQAFWDPFVCYTAQECSPGCRSFICSLIRTLAEFGTSLCDWRQTSHVILSVSQPLRDMRTNCPLCVVSRITPKLQKGTPQKLVEGQGMDRMNPLHFQISCGRAPCTLIDTRSLNMPVCNSVTSSTWTDEMLAVISLSKVNDGLCGG